MNEEHLNRMILFSGYLLGSLVNPEDEKIFKQKLKENDYLRDNIKALRNKLTDVLGEIPGRGRRKDDVSNFDSAFDKTHE
jgi:hypothetical protein